MWYLGGKARQAKQIVAAIRLIRPNFKVYVEPFCGAMWSATAVIKEFPGRHHIFNDINPHLMTFWKAAYEGWNPPEFISEETYTKYNKARPINDPMTGYVGFAWSFGGKFFGRIARTNNKIKGSYKSTRNKIDILRSANCLFNTGPYEILKIPNKAMVYLDPPYVNRTKHSQYHKFNKASYLSWAKKLAIRCDVLATEFEHQSNWPILHNYGDTVVRHHAAKPKDGTFELLMRVSS